MLEALQKPIDAQVKEIVTERARVAKALEGMPCVKNVYPSQANFLLVKVSDADALYDALVKEGVIVRNRSRVPLCKQCLRITIGLKEENEKMLATVKSFK